MSKRTARQAIKDAITANDNRLMNAGEIRAAIPLDEVTTQAIYNSLSTMKLTYKELDYVNGTYRLNTLPPHPIDVQFDKAVEERLSQPPVEVAQEAGSEALNVVVKPVGLVAEAPQYPEQDRRSKIQWSPDEQWTLARQVHTIRKDGYSDLLLAIEKAQRQVLPKERRRAITNRNMVGDWLYPILDILKHNDTLQAAVKALENRPPPPPPPLNYAELGTNLMLSELLQRGTVLLRNIMIQALTSKEVQDMLRPPAPPTEVPRHNPTPFGIERERLPKVMIYGLHKPIHRQEIERDFKDKLLVRWGDTKDPGAMLKQKNAQMDKVFVLTDYVPHSLTDTMKSELVPYQMLTGSITRLREALNEYLASE